MIPQYVPILRAKAAEVAALEHLKTHQHEQILPLFDVPRFTEKTNKLVKYKTKSNPIECYLDDIATQVASVRRNNSVLIDMHNWKSTATIETGEHALRYIIKNLNSKKVLTIPVIGYDRWEDNFEYQNALKSITNTNGKYCLRLESYAFSDMVEEHFQETLDNIINTLNLNTGNCSVILDFGDLTNSSIPDIEVKIAEALNALSPYRFHYISVAGCSVTTIINDMVPKVDSDKVIIRKEMVAWRASKKYSNASNLVFGDYGVVNPTAQIDIIAPHANGKIKYTISNNYFVVRGHSRSKGNKGAQMYDLAKVIINSPYFMNEDFSWGDSQILDCSKELLKGNLAQWISFDTNHHISAVLSEVFEFERTLVKTNTSIA